MDRSRAGAGPTRVVILGASNVALSLTTAIEVARRNWRPPLRILSALGHGRSYGRRSRMLWRALPSIIDCGLWADLDDRSGEQTHAVITDVGNDLLYGQPVDRVADWVEQCVDRLLRIEARVVITSLPNCTLESLSPLRYRFFRSLFVPSCRLDLSVIRRRAASLDRRLAELARSREITRIEPPAHWYGLDPIHVRRRSHWSLWMTLLAPHREAPRAAVDPGTVKTARHGFDFERSWRFGIERVRAQPCAFLADDVSVALY